MTDVELRNNTCKLHHSIIIRVLVIKTPFLVETTIEHNKLLRGSC